MCHSYAHVMETNSNDGYEQFSNDSTIQDTEMNTEYHPQAIEVQRAIQETIGIKAMEQDMDTMQLEQRVIQVFQMNTLNTHHRGTQSHTKSLHAGNSTSREDRGEETPIPKG